MHIKTIFAVLLLSVSTWTSAAPGDNEIVKSPVTALSGGNATITLPVPRDHSHNFAGVVYYDSSTGGDSDRVTPSAGSETYTLETPVKPGVFQSFTDNTAAANTPSQVNWGTNTTRVRVVLSGIAGNGVTHAQLIFFGNEQ